MSLLTLNPPFNIFRLKKYIDIHTFVYREYWEEYHFRWALEAPRVVTDISICISVNELEILLKGAISNNPATT